MSLCVSILITSPNLWAAIKCSKVFEEASPQSTHVDGGFESYSRRPDILSVPSRRLKNSELPYKWRQWQRASLFWVSYLFELYPKKHFIFMARDAEYTFDIADILSRNTKDADRIHLVNISRNSSQLDRSGVLEYFKQKVEQVSVGEAPIIVDPFVWKGTIQKNLEIVLGSDSLQKMIVETMLSSNGMRYPNNDAEFLSGILRVIDDRDGFTIEYEHLPHYTASSLHYRNVKGDWQAFSESSLESKQAALEIMGDIRATINNKKTNALSTQLRLRLRELFEFLKGNTNKLNIEELGDYLLANWNINLWVMQVSLTNNVGSDFKKSRLNELNKRTKNLHMKYLDDTPINEGGFGPIKIY